eukprot:8518634-Prorocentrum_lima.AAC.1
MAAQSLAMLNREGEAHLHLQQSIENVANELIRVTYVTASSLQKLANDGENHRQFVESALTTWTASVEAQVREQVQRLHLEQAPDVGRGVEMFVTQLVERKWEESERAQASSTQTPSHADMVRVIENLARRLDQVESNQEEMK